MLERLMPKGPDFVIDWPTVFGAISLLQGLSEVPQSPRFHAEGDVLTHTQMVAESLVSTPDWRNLEDDTKAILFAAALLHDIGKAKTTIQNDDGSWSSPGHSKRGVRMARRLLWENEVPYAARETVVNLIRYHQMPFWIFERDDKEHLIRQISQNVSCRQLALLAQADAKGRICEDKADTLTAVTLFEELAEQMGCIDTPAFFATPHARFLYFRNLWPTPEIPPFEDFTGKVMVLAGLPGAGKDHFAAASYPDLPTISLDRIRGSLGIAPGKKKQGQTIQRAREQAKVYLRKGESFIWNATNVSRGIRSQVVDLAWQYQAKIEVIYIEPAKEILFGQNRNRDAAVPENVIWDLLDHRLDIPDPWEAHLLSIFADC